MSKQFTIFFLLILLWGFTIAQWSSDPMVNTMVTDTDTEQTIPKVALAPNGDYYIGYFSKEQGNYNVRLQRYTNDGFAKWVDNGILISDHPSMSWLTDWNMTVDKDNHAILTFQDIRTGHNNIVAYRISPEGEFSWGENGIILSDSDNFDNSPVVTVTAANHAVFAWGSENTVIMQKINAEGEKQWGDWGITLSLAGASLSWPQLIAVGEDDVVMKVYRDTGTFFAPIRHIYAQRFGSDGTPAWPDYTVVYNTGFITGFTQILSFIGDGEDGFYIAWHDYTLSGTEATPWLQHVNGLGEPTFPANGLQLSNRNDFNQWNPIVVNPEDDDHVYVYWTEATGNQNFRGIFGQKVSPEGNLLWTSGGAEVVSIGSAVSLYAADASANNGVIVYGNTSQQIKAMALNDTGEAIWPEGEVSITDVSSTASHFAFSEFDGLQWVYAWGHTRQGSINIFAQNLTHFGTLGSAISYPLTLEVNPENSGSVEGAGEYYRGDSVYLSAMAQEGYIFSAWTLDVDTMSYEPGFVFIMPPEDVHLVAHFEALPETFSVTFRVNMITAENFDPDADSVYITGSMLSWDTPGENPDLQVMQQVDDTWAWTKTLELEAGSYDYKYFMNDGWDSGEWDGEPNRLIFVEGEKSVDDIWGSIDPVFSLTLLSVPEEGGAISGEGEFAPEESIEVSAVANPGFQFLHWLQDNEVMSDESSFSFLMPYTDVVLSAVFQSTTSIHNASHIHLSLFPNPTEERFTVRAGSEIKRISISDLFGRNVYVSDVSGGEAIIDVDWNAGMYIITIEMEDRTDVRKLYVR